MLSQIINLFTFVFDIVSQDFNFSDQLHLVNQESLLVRVMFALKLIHVLFVLYNHSRAV